MSSIVPLDGSGGALPAYLKNRAALAQINSDVLSGASFPVLSIKGKIFTMVKGGERKVLTRIVDGEEEPKTTIQLAVVRANVKARVFYAKGYVEGDSDGSPPTCKSNDGIAPSADAAEPQAKKCQACPHSVWGSKPGKPGDEEGGKGTACSVNTRLAVVDPDDPSMPFLLRVPAGSKKNYAEVVKIAENRSIPYNALVLRVGFDPEAPSPRLTFKPVGVLPDAQYETVSRMYESAEIKEMVGLLEVKPAQGDSIVNTDELDAAINAKAAVEKAKEGPKVSAEEVAAAVDPKPAKAAPKAEKKTTPPVVADSGASALLADLDTLLSMKDD